MRSFVVVALWVSVRAVVQPADSIEEALASWLLASQPARSTLNRQVRSQVAPTSVRASPVNMQLDSQLALGDDVVQFSWLDIGSGDIATQLKKLTGPCVQDMDLVTFECIGEKNDNFDKFIAAAQSQGTLELLQGAGPFTLLVPVDSSITTNVDTKAHVLKGRFTHDDIADGGSAETLAGTTVQFSKALRTVKVNDAAVPAIFNAADHRGGKSSTAFPFDVKCTNGLIHALEEPLAVTNEPLSFTPSTQAQAPAPTIPGSFAEYMASRGATAPVGGGAPLQKTGPDGIWDLKSKKRVFDAWDPEKPRDYDNFNPFERDLDGAVCDTNGCYPGESRGYKSPLRPDQNWEVMQEEQKLMDEYAKDPKFHIKGRPGNYELGWQDNLGAPP